MPGEFHEPQPAPLGEAELVQRSVKEERFIGLLTTSHRAIYGYVRTLVANAADADDCMQEVSLQLWRRFDEFTEASFARWARGFVRNVARNYYRRRRARHLALDDDLIDRLSRVQGGALELLELRRERLRGCMERLSRADRELLRGYYDEGESVERLSKRTGRSADAVYRALRRIRLALFRCVDRQLREED